MSTLLRTTLFSFLLVAGFASFSQSAYTPNKQLQNQFPAYFREAAAQYKIFLPKSFLKHFFPRLINMNSVTQAGGAVVFIPAVYCTCMKKPKTVYCIMKQCACYNC